MSYYIPLFYMDKTTYLSPMLVKLNSVRKRGPRLDDGSPAISHHRKNYKRTINHKLICCNNSVKQSNVLILDNAHPGHHPGRDDLALFPSNIHGRRGIKMKQTLQNMSHNTSTRSDRPLAKYIKLTVS